MSERLKKIHLIISIIAALTILVGFLVYHVTGMAHGYLAVAMWVSLAIIIFYFIGVIAREFLRTSVFPEPIVEEEEEETEESPEETESEPEPEPEDKVMVEGPLLDELDVSDFDDDL